MSVLGTLSPGEIATVMLTHQLGAASLFVFVVWLLGKQTPVCLQSKVFCFTGLSLGWKP